jgi:4-alpha-glucanotransferase
VAEEARASLPQWPWWKLKLPPRGIVPDGRTWALTLEDGGTQEGAAIRCPPCRSGFMTSRVGRVGLHAHLGARAPSAAAPILGRDAAPSRACARRDRGLADYTDLAMVAEGLACVGADFVGLNPIHAGFWGDAGGFSPYTPVPPPQAQRVSPARWRTPERRAR